jgi:hypothetical protein
LTVLLDKGYAVGTESREDIMFDTLTLTEKCELFQLLHEGYMAADRYWADRARAHDTERCQQVCRVLEEINYATADLSFA